MPWYAFYLHAKTKCLFSPFLAQERKMGKQLPTITMHDDISFWT